MITSLKGNGEYYVFWRVFSPVQVGIPQNWPRVFIIGFLASTQAAHHFKWPQVGKIQARVDPIMSFFSKTDKLHEEAFVPNPHPDSQKIVVGGLSLQ